MFMKFDKHEFLKMITVLQETKKILIRYEVAKGSKLK